MVVALIKRVNIMLPIVMTRIKSRIEKSYAHPTDSWKAISCSYQWLHSVGIRRTIIRASAPLKLHHESICCQDIGICSSILKALITPNGRYTLIALAIITTKITIEIGSINSLKLISTQARISPIKIKTKEFDINAKNDQNFSIYSSTFGLILYLP